ncbi:hypothetical protein, partial [uncultured Alistipes sp.]|uniref:hypothetical protein n=1 Tax=uncultured Alistipes sp. TaxID=538949 RepID=UPI00265870C3
MGRTDKGAGRLLDQGSQDLHKGLTPRPIFVSITAHLAALISADFHTPTHILSGSVSDIQATCMG